MNANRNAIRAMLGAAAVALAVSAHAQSCSGGPDGGMDATGNQCSHANPVAASSATPNMNSAPKTTATPRSVAAASQLARPEGAASREQMAASANRAAQPAKGPELASVAPRAVKVRATTGAN